MFDRFLISITEFSHSLIRLGRVGNDEGASSVQKKFDHALPRNALRVSPKILP